MKWRDNLDLTWNELKNAVIHVNDSFLQGAREGQAIYHSSLQTICVCINDNLDTRSSLAWKCFASPEDAKIQVEDEGVSSLTTDTLNFIGENVNVQQDPVETDKANVYIFSKEPVVINDVNCEKNDSIRDAVYLVGYNSVKRAIATSKATGQVFGFIKSKESDTKCTIITRGILDGFNGGGLKANKQYFLSKNYEGGITDVPPNNTNEVLARVGRGVTNSKLFVDVDPNIIIRS